MDCTPSRSSPEYQHLICAYVVVWVGGLEVWGIDDFVNSEKQKL